MSTLLEQASLVMIPSGYKEDVVYSQIPTSGAGDLSFTRASNGTRINSAGLVEVCPWNLADNSENFSAVYIPIYATLSNNTTSAPNGTTTADSLLETTDTEVHAITTDYTQPSGAEYTYSVYVKTISGRNVRVSGSSGFTGPIALVDLSNGSLLSGSTGASVASVGGGWYRISLTATTTTTQVRILIYSMNGTATTFAGSTSNGVYLWGAQLNIGSTAKPYFPTTDRLNVPRLTYQNGGGGCPSLLLEKQSTNVCTYSQDFSNAAWDTSNVDSGCSLTITPNYTTASNGLPAARLVASRTSTSTIAALVNYSPNTGATATKSIWMKNNNSGNVTIMFGDEAVTITDSWERYSVTNTYLYSIIGLRYSGVALSCDISITGSQFELGSYPTSYIPTTSSSATRVADACFKTGISSLIGQTEGTLFADIDFKANTGEVGIIMEITSGAGTQRILIYYSSTTILCYANASVFSYSQTTSERLKIAFAYKSGDSAFYVNGVQKAVSSASLSYSSLSQLNIGSNYTNDQPTNSPTNQAVLFKTRLTNAELASITTI